MTPSAPQSSAMLNPKGPTRPKSETSNPMRFMILLRSRIFRFAPSGFRLTLRRNLGARLQANPYAQHLLEFSGNFPRRRHEVRVTIRAGSSYLAAPSSSFDASRLFEKGSAADAHRVLRLLSDEGSARATRRVHPQSGGGSGEHEGFESRRARHAVPLPFAPFAFLAPLRAR
jgi:hypothetical protein